MSAWVDISLWKTADWEGAYDAENYTAYDSEHKFLGWVSISPAFMHVIPSDLFWQTGSPPWRDATEEEQIAVSVAILCGRKDPNTDRLTLP